MIKSKKIIWAALCLGLVMSVAGRASAASNVKIAFVDMRRVLNESNEGKRAMAKLQSAKDKLQKKIDKKEKALMAKQEKLKEQQSILSQEALQKKAQAYYQEVQELQQSYGQFQQELAAKEMKATQRILAKIQKIVEKIGKSEGYTMIYDRSGGAVVWAPSHLDLTDKVIKAYNKANK